MRSLAEYERHHDQPGCIFGVKKNGAKLCYTCHALEQQRYRARIALEQYWREIGLA